MCVVYSNKNKLEQVFKCLGDPPPTTHHLTLVDLHCWTVVIHHYNRMKEKNLNKIVLFKNNQLYWIDLLKKNGSKTVAIIDSI